MADVIGAPLTDEPGTATADNQAAILAAVADLEARVIALFGAATASGSDVGYGGRSILIYRCDLWRPVVVAEGEGGAGPVTEMEIAVPWAICKLFTRRFTQTVEDFSPQEIAVGEYSLAVPSAVGMDEGWQARNFRSADDVALPSVGGETFEVTGIPEPRIEAGGVVAAPIRIAR